jgi:hypothetical protein
MPAIASLEELKEIKAKLDEIKAQHPEGYNAIKELLATKRSVGYKNIIKMFLGETTPEKLKEEKQNN